MFEKLDVEYEKIKEAFQYIESEDFISNVDRSAIVLTYEGVKPVSEIDFSKLFFESIDEFTKRKNKVLEELSKIGLYWKKQNSESEEYESYLISKDIQGIEKVEALSLVDEDFSEDFSKDYYDTGKLFGYPETAIQGYVEGQTIPFEDIDKLEYRDRLLLRYFINIRLSKENFRKELDVLHKQCEVIQKYMPDFYEKVTTSPELEFTPAVFREIFNEGKVDKYKDLLQRLFKYLKRFGIKEIQNPESGKLISIEKISELAS